MHYLLVTSVLHRGHCTTPFFFLLRSLYIQNLEKRIITMQYLEEILRFQAEYLDSYSRVTMNSLIQCGTFVQLH